jgi:hypothetical protein
LSYEAAINYKRGGELVNNSELAKTVYHKAVNLFLEGGYYNTAANIYAKTADMDVRNGYIVEAIVGYEEAYKHYNTGDSPVSGSICLLKAVDLMIATGEYCNAIFLLEKVNEYYVTTDFLFEKGQELILDIAVLKIYSSGINEARLFLDNCLIYAATEEYKLIKELIINYESGNIVGYFLLLRNPYFKLWHIKLLSKLKNEISIIMPI